MSQILRSWLAFAALGAGILHLALVISSPVPLAVALFALGASEFAWGVATLAQDRFVLVTAARAGTLAPVLLWGTLILVSGLLDAPEFSSSLAFIPMAVATVFDLAIAVSLSILLRRSGGRMPAAPSTATSRPWRYLGSLFTGGLAVSMLMTPALALTEAGLNNPHATHGTTPGFEPGGTEHPGH